MSTGWLSRSPVGETNPSPGMGARVGPCVGGRQRVGAPVGNLVGRGVGGLVVGGDVGDADDVHDVDSSTTVTTSLLTDASAPPEAPLPVHDRNAHVSREDATPEKSGPRYTNARHSGAPAASGCPGVALPVSVSDAHASAQYSLQDAPDGTRASTPASGSPLAHVSDVDASTAYVHGEYAGAGS